MKLVGLFKEAFAKAGVPLPEVEKRTPNHPRKHRRKKTAGPAAENETKQGTRGSKKPKRNREYPPDEARTGKSVTVTANGVLITRSKSTTADLRPPNVKPKMVESVSGDEVLIHRPADDYTITVAPDAKVIWNTLEAKQIVRLLDNPLDGTAIHLNNSTHEKTLYLGLDFGTSTLKAVICDKEREITYAVPFRHAQGVQGYLLPSRLYLSEGGYNLEGHGQISQDLKLGLLANPESLEAQMPAVAFLALSLRQIRGWFLSAHGDTYTGTILWEIAMGLPVANRCDDNLSHLYRLIGIAAWIVSTASEVTPLAVRQALQRSGEICAGSVPEADEEDIEVRVEPEIAAQIYGFVSSGAYDPHASNIFLMVDVGAGTLDASVFRIDRKPGQTKDALYIFRSTVAPLGVMNLHTKRMDWLHSALSKETAPRADLLEGVQAIRYITDAVEAIPDHIAQYCSGVAVQFYGADPDKLFYGQVRSQVGEQTYAYVENKRLLGRHQIKNMPMFLCGGGSNSVFYSKLKKDLQSAPGFSWFGVSPKPLQKPRGLKAPGLNQKHYDRLSVAFGLSQLRLDSLIDEVPPLEEEPEFADYRDRYVDQ